MLLCNLLHLYSVLYPGAVENALAHFTCKHKIAAWHDEVPWFFLETVGFVALMTCGA